MVEAFEEMYDKHLAGLREILPKIDPNFANRVMYLERKLADEAVKEPQLILTIEYKPNVDMDKKLYDLREVHSLEAEYSDKHNILFAMSRMRLAKVEEISQDGDIVSISGKASPIIRS